MDHRSIHLARRVRTWNGFPIFAAALTLAGALGAAEPDKTLALDPQCAWGRLADGRGRLVRCLMESEALRLRAADAPASDAARPPAPPPEAPRVSWPTPVAETPAPPSVSAVPAPPAAPPAPPGSDSNPPPAESTLIADIGPVVADVGALPDALKSLRKAKDRVAECVDKNGGLSADRGEVEVRFLVQARGRAEGVSVKKKRGINDLAAKCIADVVDRRYVGYPEEPTVGATLSVTITKKKK